MKFPGFHSTPVFEVSILLSTLCLQKLLSPTAIFSFAKFSSLHRCQWFLNFSFKTDKETTQPPLSISSHFHSHHVILPLPKEVSSLLLPAEFHIIPTSPPSQISLYLFHLFWFSLLPLCFISLPHVPSACLHCESGYQNVVLMFFFYLVWGIPFVDVSKARAACVMNVYFNVNRVMKPPVPSCLWFRILPDILYSPMEPLSICHPWHNCHWANSSYHCLLLPSFTFFSSLPSKNLWRKGKTHKTDWTASPNNYS